MRMGLHRVVLVLVTALFVPLVPAGAQEAGPPLSVPPAKLADALECYPAEGRHEPVLLVHGTTVTAYENWGWNWVPAMNRMGYFVCTVELPNRAMDDIQVASEYVVYAVRAMAERTGRRIDIAGLSQGGLQPRWAVKWWPGIRPLVDDLVTIVATNHGFQGHALCTNGCPPSIWQQLQGSNFLAALNAGDETPGVIDYTSIFSLTDPIVNPQFPESTSALDGASNIYVQDVCPGRPVDHVQSAYDPVVFALALDAFSHRGPGNYRRVDVYNCAQLFMPGIDPAEALVRHALVYAYGFPYAAGVLYPGVEREPDLAPYAREPGE